MLKCLSCPACEVEAPGQKHHMAYDGCMAFIEDRLERVDMNKAFSDAAADLFTWWKEAVIHEAIRDIVIERQL